MMQRIVDVVDVGQYLRLYQQMAKLIIVLTVVQRWLGHRKVRNRI